MKKPMVFLFVFQFFWVSHFQMATGKTAKKKTHCTTAEVSTKHCRLETSSHVIQFMPEKVIVNDKINKSIHKLPMSGDEVQWHKLKLRKLNRRWILDIYIWDKPVSEAQIQSLHWYLFEIKKTQFIMRSDEIVQKRRPDGKGEKTTFIRDKMLKHSLKSIKGQLHWKAGLNKGYF